MATEQDTMNEILSRMVSLEANVLKKMEENMVSINKKAESQKSPPLTKSTSVFSVFDKAETPEWTKGAWVNL